MPTLSGTRSMRLPAGWYPRDAGEVARLVGAWLGDVTPEGASFASVSPHAGWAFSGDLAARSVAALRPSDTVVIVAGHLGCADPLLAAYEQSYETVQGLVDADAILFEALISELREDGIPAPERDRYADNGVETLLPLVAALQPGARALWLRCPPNFIARQLGAALMRAAAATGKTVSVVGSTDLTHYGPAYGFSPMGSGEKARAWVRNVNDRAFVAALESMNPTALLEAAVSRGAACSGGAAAAALCFALESGATEARILGRSLSCDVRPDDSFVGYCAAAFA